MLGKSLMKVKDACGSKIAHDDSSVYNTNIQNTPTVLDKKRPSNTIVTPGEYVD